MFKYSLVKQRARKLDLYVLILASAVTNSH